MSALKFHPLKVKDVRAETADCVSVSLEVPETLSDLFRFAPGQYLTFRRHVDGAEIRRSYSICSSPRDGELRVAIKKVEEGKFSTYAHSELKAGDVLDVMPPMGKFTPRPSEKMHKQYLAFASGSGITPIMSIMKTVLEEEPGSSFTLVYGNRSRNSVIFRESIEALKNTYMERLRLFHVLSREYMEVPLFSGRINAAKAKEFCEKLIDLSAMDANKAAAGDQAFAFLGTGDFTHHAGELRYGVDSAGAHVYGDVNGDGVADFHILVAGLTTLLASDFIL